MNGLNKVMLIGNLGKDPEVRTIGDNVKVANFPLATSEMWKDKDGQRQTKTEWHNVVCWKGLAGIAESYFKKGDTVYIEGKIETRSWDDKEGNKKYITEIKVEQLIMMPKPKQS